MQNSFCGVSGRKTGFVLFLPSDTSLLVATSTGEPKRSHQMEARNDWSNFVGMSASVWTILQMLSPLPTCYQFITKQTVGDMIVTPYVVALTSCTLWLFYGFIIENVTIMRVNTIGAGLQFSYTLCYYLYCIKKSQVRKQVLVGIFVVATAMCYAYIESNFGRLVSFLGLFCSCVTVAFFASPLANMHYVIKVWNSESLPRLLIAATFIVSLQWAVYGYMIDDGYVLITNLLGTILSSLQLVLLLIIPRESNPKLVSTI